MEDKSYPGWSDESNPAVFTKMPEQPKEKKPGHLSGDQIKKFFHEGFVVVEDFFSPEDLQPCRDAVEKLVDEFAQNLHRKGKIQSLHKDKGLFQRLGAIENEFPGSTILTIKQSRLVQEFKDLWTNERLLNAVEQLIGPNIMGHPVWNLRYKTPQNEATTVPWHQDAAYLENSTYGVLQPAAWIPLLDTNETTGCMEMIVGGHRSGRVGKHTCCWADTWYVILPEDEMSAALGVDMERDRRICPVPYGGMLLLNNLVPHRSLPNLSTDIRWSLDLRWQAPNKPVGFYGIRQGVLMRSAKDPDLKVNWDELQETEKKLYDPDVDEFDTTMPSPWMEKWEITHANRHTARFLEYKLKPWN
ncbi:1-deoxypentalenic acid 11-beta-hydroxylase-like [Haliotis rubra]|uniref:1-deoxypentalenic acid 11-beta-hydroxylase-like n=1 Tax=Haliotis rubra TaxID=36100 RepID=UPI001EE5478B|nr:1-deoxypentalenic acid 11-beta-hydroxylase-like [Haliotis rubra]